jgi:hypothetical protein
MMLSLVLCTQIKHQIFLAMNTFKNLRAFGLVIAASSLLLVSCDDDDSPEPGPSATATLFTDGTDAATGLPSTSIVDRGEGIGTRTLTNDRVWILDGFAFVSPGQTVTIEPGTIIKGEGGQGSAASAFIVSRGGRCIADGAADAPIIFTYEGDPLGNNDETTPIAERGLWGGVIVLGNASLNSTPGETAIEGIPTSETRGLYGGNDDDDDSGIFRYISIRHGGTDIGAGNEINGLTLGGVGRGTVVEYVEVVGNVDDGVEWFGGTVDCKHLIVTGAGDDSYDYDEGWRGRVQYSVAIQDPAIGDRGGEHDGGTDPETGTPFATPVFFNSTYVGRGLEAGTRLITMRDNAGGEYHNSIFVNFAQAVDIEKLTTEGDSYKMFQDGLLAFAGNIFYDVVNPGTASTAADLFKVAGGDVDQNEIFALSFAANGNVVTNPELTYSGSNLTEVVSTLNLIPSIAATGGAVATDEFFDNVTYRGAFAPGGTNWAQGWTKTFGDR